jgi:hypothetical protein
MSLCAGITPSSKLRENDCASSVPHRVYLESQTYFHMWVRDR